MAHTLVERSATVNPGSSESVAVPFTTPAAGNLLALFVTIDKGSGGGEAIAGWDKVVDVESGGYGVSTLMYWRESDGTETTVTAAWDGTALHSAWVEEWDGFSGTIELDVSAGAGSYGTASAQSTGTTATTTTTAGFALAVWAIDSGNTDTPPSVTNGFTVGSYFRGSGGGDPGLATAWAEITALQTVETTFTNAAGADEMAAGVAVFKGPAGDTTDPTLTSSTPADGATDVAPSGFTLALGFDEAVVAGSGSLTLYKTSVGAFEVIPIGDGRIVFSGSSVTVTPSGTLDAGAAYHVLIDATAVEDAVGNTYAGIVDATTLNFATATAVTVEASALADAIADTQGAASPDCSSAAAGHGDTVADAQGAALAAAATDIQGQADTVTDSQGTASAGNSSQAVAVGLADTVANALGQPTAPSSVAALGLVDTVGDSLGLSLGAATAEAASQVDTVTDGLGTVAAGNVIQTQAVSLLDSLLDELGTAPVVASAYALSLSENVTDSAGAVSLPGTVLAPSLLELLSDSLGDLSLAISAQATAVAESLVDSLGTPTAGNATQSVALGLNESNADSQGEPSAALLTTTSGHLETLGDALGILLPSLRRAAAGLSDISTDSQGAPVASQTAPPLAVGSLLQTISDQLGSLQLSLECSTLGITEVATDYQGSALALLSPVAIGLLDSVADSAGSPVATSGPVAQVATILEAVTDELGALLVSAGRAPLGVADSTTDFQGSPLVSLTGNQSDTLIGRLVSLMPALNAIGGKLGANPFSVSIRSKSTADLSAMLRGGAPESTGLLTLLEGGQNPAVQFRERDALALGLPSEHLLRVGPVTPDHDGGGYSPDQLTGSDSEAVEYLITGPGFDATRYALESLNTSDPLGTYLNLRRL